MKKQFTILSAIFLLLFSLNAKAQDDFDNPTAKSYLALVSGYSIPQGSFASTSYSNYKSGFAKTGVTIGLDAGIYVYKNLGIGVTFSWQDQGELNTNDAQTIANGYNTELSKDQTTVVSVNRYHNYMLMAGPQYSFLYKKFTLDLRADAGVIKNTSSPAITTTFDYSTSAAATYYQLNSGHMAFAYGGSVGLKYSLGDHWDVGLRANYVDCSGIKIDNTGNPGNSGRIQNSLSISVLQTTLGFALKF